MSVDAKRDLLWIGLVSALILFWGSIPTWAGYQAQTRELRFRGTYYDPQDYAVHIGAMEAGRQGEWAYQFRFTTALHNAASIQLFSMVLGRFNRWPGLDTESAFQLARLISGFLALFALYRLMRFERNLSAEFPGPDNLKLVYDSLHLQIYRVR